MKIINSLPPVVAKDTLVCLDVETFQQPDKFVHRPTGKFACLSICLEGQTVYQIYDEKQIKLALSNLSKGVWIFQNALYDLMQLRRFAKIPPRFIWDTMLVDQAMNGGKFLHYGLSDLSRRWLKKVMIKDVRDDFSKATVMTKEMKEYAALDVIDTLAIAKLQMEEYEEELSFRAYTEIDEPAIFPILDMPGISVDVKGWKVMIEEFKEIAQRLERELGVNVFSSAKVKEEAKKHGLNLLDTNAKTLEQYMNNPFVAKVSEARRYRKAVSTYGLSWLESVEEDGKVYSAYRVTGAETGRMSSAHPPMQNIPVRKLPQYRSRFVASPGCVIVVSDVSQQEPSILAYETKDPVLVEAFKNGEDIHTTVATSIYGKMDKKDPEFSEKRSVGKTINLGTSYGLTEFGLADKLKITKDEAARILRQYFTRFRGVFSWISQQRMSARNNGYVKTAIGRKIYLNPYNMSFDNNAINAPIQGGAADFTKKWVRLIWEKCNKAKIPYCVVGIIHDEIVSDVPKEHLKKYLSLLDEAFNETAKFLYKGIPFKAETVQGRSWGVKQNKEEGVEDDDE